MKYLNIRLIAFLLITTISGFVALHDGTASSAAQSQGNGPDNKFRRARNPVQGQYIVRLKDDIRPEDVDFVANQLLARHQGTTLGVYRNTIKGFAIQMPEAAAIALSHEPSVASVEEDGIVKVAATQSNPPWGLDRIDQRDLPRNNTYNFANVTTGAGVHVYMLDSGVNPVHPEFLNPNGTTRVTQDASFWFTDGNDCAQHGTPVASVIGGNTLGVAKDVRIHSVKVVDCFGNGAYSSVIAGIEWVNNNAIKPAIVNMSFGGDVDDDIEEAVRASMAQKGLAYVVSAGNDGVDAKDTTPARMPEVITVGATDKNDTRAVFFNNVGSSNWGPSLDLFAPGKDIMAAWPVDLGFDGIPDTKLVDGTSVAAAHVTGVLARLLQASPNLTPAALQGIIKNLATPDKVQDRGQGSPNLLLYSEVHAGFVRQGASPPINESDTMVDSGIDLGPNEFLTITGTGTINAGVFLGGDNGPEGWNSIETNPAFPLPGTRPFSLLGSLDSQLFYIGKSTATTDRFTSPRRLFLRTNDDVPGNGSGAFNAFIQVFKPLPDALSNFVGQSVPKTLLLPGETMNVSVTMRNLGPSTWTAGQQFRLGAIGTGWEGGRAYLPGDVPPNTDVTFNFTVSAPSVPGNYNFRWQMLQEGVQFFGDATPNIPITVLAPSNQAEFVSQQVPASMYVGEPYAVSVTMRNTGNTTWAAGSVFKLGSQNPQDNMTWGFNRVVVTQPVPPGATYTFNFGVTAPSPKGTYNFQWRMVKEGVEWFGAYTDNKAVIVKLPSCLRC